MTKKIDIIIANPAGNITIMVITPTPRNEYKTTAAKLLNMDFGGEQVEYILPYNGEGLPAMEMCGLEFCGNGSRAFAYYRAAKFGDGELMENGCRKLEISVSGCDYPLTAIVDVSGSDAQVQMPVPVNIVEIDGNTMIDLGGISHMILYDVPADQKKFDEIRARVYEKYPDTDAFGIMFMDTNSDTMVPVVYVSDVDTTYFEGSCASGATAASCARALSENALEGTFHYTFKQPAGTLYTTVSKKEGKITDIQLSGLLELSDVITVDI